MSDLRHEFARHVADILGCPAEDATDGRGVTDGTVWCRIHPPHLRGYRTIFTHDAALAHGDLRALAEYEVQQQGPRLNVA